MQFSKMGKARVCSILSSNLEVLCLTGTGPIQPCSRYISSINSSKNLPINYQATTILSGLRPRHIATIISRSGRPWRWNGQLDWNQHGGHPESRPVLRPNIWRSVHPGPSWAQGIFSPVWHIPKGSRSSDKEQVNAQIGIVCLLLTPSLSAEKSGILIFKP